MRSRSTSRTSRKWYFHICIYRPQDENHLRSDRLRSKSRIMSSLNDGGPPGSVRICRLQVPHCLYIERLRRYGVKPEVDCLPWPFPICVVSGVTRLMQIMMATRTHAPEKTIYFRCCLSEPTASLLSMRHQLSRIKTTRATIKLVGCSVKQTQIRFFAVGCH